MLDVGCLRALITAGEQYHEYCTPLHEVEPVTRAVVDAQLADAFAHRFHVAEVAGCRKSLNPCVDLCHGLPVFQLVQPAGKSLALDDFEHEASVIHDLQYGKRDYAIIHGSK